MTDISEHEPQASACYISRAFSNFRSVLSQSNTPLCLRLLYLLYDTDLTHLRDKKAQSEKLTRGSSDTTKVQYA